MGVTLPRCKLSRRQQGVLALLIASLPVLAFAASTGTPFKAFYDFVHGAATGYLGRGVAIAGGLLMLGVAAATGKAANAILGVVLAIFGALGPAIIDAIFAAGIVPGLY